jgi:hypothetical protein
MGATIHSDALVSQLRAWVFFRASAMLASLAKGKGKGKATPVQAYY